MSWRFGFSAGRLAVLVAIGVAALLVTAIAVIPMAMVGGASMLFAAGVGCPSSGTRGHHPARGDHGRPQLHPG